MLTMRKSQYLQLFIGRFVIAVLLAAAAVSGKAATIAEPGSPDRIAFVVSNSVYANPKDALPGALRDARLIQATLEDKRLGFHVTFVRNTSKQQLEQAIRNFKAALERAGPTAVGFFYYAGHGGTDAAGSDNYLIPTDVDNVFAADLPTRAVSLRKMNELLAQVDRKPAVVVVIDACRTPPAAPAAGAGRGRGAASGATLKLVPPDEPKAGFLLALSASTMTGAPDNGPYASTLASKLLAEGLTIEQVFEQVRHEVSKSTRLAQIPVERSKTVDQVCLVSCGAAAAAAGPYSQNSVLLGSSMHAADLAVKRLAEMKAESRCANGWKSIVALRKSADKALKEGHPDAAGATFVQLKTRTEEIQAYLSVLEQSEQNRTSQAAYAKERRAREVARAKDAYDEDLSHLTYYLKSIKETAARMKTPVDTGEIDRLKTAAERLAASGKIEDASDRLVDALNLAIPMLESERNMPRNKRRYAMRNPGQVSNPQAEAGWARMQAQLSAVCE
jgi:uncharacterized caspase-like protein